jgi:hypothetical protein
VDFVNAARYLGRMSSKHRRKIAEQLRDYLTERAAVEGVNMLLTVEQLEALVRISGGGAFGGT